MRNEAKLLTLLIMSGTILYTPMAFAQAPIQECVEAYRNASAAQSYGNMPFRAVRSHASSVVGSAKTVMNIETTQGGELASKLGDKANSVDSLIVTGPINDADFNTMWQATFYGKLTAINLQHASVESGTVPDRAFFHVNEQLIGEDLYSTKLEQVLLPEGVRTIGAYAFAYNINLAHVSLPTTLRQLGESAFESDRNLTASRMVLPEGMQEVGAQCFYDCGGLQCEWVLPSTLKRIGDRAFYSCGITKVNLPDSLEEIGAQAFMRTNIKEAHVPDGCVLKGDKHFAECRRLEKLGLPAGLDSVPNGIARLDINLRELSMPASAKHIGDDAFLYCTSLSEIELPEGLESIGKNAMMIMDSLKILAFPSTMKTIGALSCVSLSRLEKIYCAAMVPPTCQASGDDAQATPFGNLGHTSLQATPKDVIVYVPKGTADLYRDAWGWNYFTNFVETEDFPTAISSVRISAGAEDGKTYDLMGRRIARPCKGQVYIKNGKKLIAR